MRDNPEGGELDFADGVRKRCKNSPSVLSYPTPPSLRSGRLAIPPSVHRRVAQPRSQQTRVRFPGRVRPKVFKVGNLSFPG